MNTTTCRWDIPLVLTLTSIIALYVLLSPTIGDNWFLGPITTLLATVSALTACSQLAQAAFDRPKERLWKLVVLAFVLVCIANVLDSASERLGAHLGTDDIGNYLTLAVATMVILSATVYLSTGPARVRWAVWLGLAFQLISVAAEFAFEEGKIAGSFVPWSWLPDFAEFLSVWLYLIAMFWIVIDTGHVAGLVPTAQPRASVGASSPYKGRSLRDGLYPPPFILGLYLPAANTPAGRVHRICNQALWPPGDVVSGGRNLFLIAMWPLIASIRAMREVRRRGNTLMRVTGKSRCRQFLEMVQLAVCHRVPPVYYYRYDLYQPEQQKLAAYYLWRYQTKEIAYRLLYPMQTDAFVPVPLKNKLGFARYCQGHGLRHIPTLAVFEKGCRIDGDDEDLPAVDLFLKPVAGKGGGGAERWHYRGQMRYRNTKGDELDGHALLAHVQELSRSEPYLVQPALRNHADLSDLTGGALCTARILTCRTQTGVYEATNAAFRMPSDAASAVDNFHAGGVASAVDIRTGELGLATDLGTEGSRWHERHPITNGQIAARRLPMWRDAMELVEGAHRVFDDYVLIGWDVAFLDDGPVLVEGNRGPDIDILQRTSKGPIGNGRFGELLAYNLEHRR